MEDKGSMQYSVSVKDKVKQLEQKVVRKKEEANNRLASPRSQESSPGARKPQDPDNSGNAAIMEVEILQLNSPRIRHNSSSTVETAANLKTKSDEKQEDSSSDSDLESHNQPVNVKELLRRFSSGMSQTFRRKSLPSGNNPDALNPSTIPERNKVELGKPKNEVVNLQRDKQPSTTGVKTVTSNNNTTVASKIMKPKSVYNLNNSVDEKLSKEQNENQSQSQRRGSLGFSKIFLKNRINTTDPSPPTSNETEAPSDNKTVEHEKNLANVQTSKTNLSVVDTRCQKEELNQKQKILSSYFSATPQPKPRSKIESVEKKVSNVSPSNDTVFLLGFGRCGKSLVANYLLQQDLSTIHKSTASAEMQIIECTITTENEGGHAGTVTLFDTPGFTKGGKQDAAMWTTLLSHMNNNNQIHDNDLVAMAPRLMIIVIKKEDEPPSQSDFMNSDSFQNFMKTLSYFHQNVFGGSPLVLFVVTHVKPLQLSDISHLTERVLKVASLFLSNATQDEKVKVCFHKVVQDATGSNIPSSLTTTYIDLMTGLKSFILNNGNKNSTLHKVFNNSFPKTIQASSLSARIPLKAKDHPESMKTHKILQNLYQNVVIEPSEVSTLLDVGWLNVDPSLRKKYSSSLLTLQQVLQRCGIMTFSQLPDTIPNILQLLKSIPQHNPALRDLLTETLQLNIPTCYPALYIGQGYNCLLDSTTHTSPFQFSGSYKTSSLGLIPDEISCRSSGDREIVFKFFTSMEDYVNSRLQDLSIKQYLPIPTAAVGDFGSNPSLLRNGYNVVKPNQDPSSCSATANVEYRQFQLSLTKGESMEFKEEFWESLQSIGELDTKSAESVETWRQFLTTWGTHIVKTAHGGGSIQVTFRGKVLTGIVKSLNQKSEPPIGGESETSKIFQWMTGDGLLNSVTRLNNNKEINDYLPLQGFDVTAKFHGGDTKFSQIDPTKLSQRGMAEAREEWMQSLEYNPLIHETSLVLIPLSQCVREKSEGLATKIDVAFNHFYSNVMLSRGNMSSCTIL